MALALNKERLESERAKSDAAVRALENHLVIEKSRLEELKDQSVCNNVLSVSQKEAEMVEEFEAMMEAIEPVQTLSKNKSIKTPYQLILRNDKMPESTSLPCMSHPTGNSESPQHKIDPLILLTKVRVLIFRVPFQYEGDSLNFPIFRKMIRSHMEDVILIGLEQRVFLTKFLTGEALELLQSNQGLSYNDAIALLEK